jgi:hypothetical protein
MEDSYAPRLDRIETKIDKISEALISLARAEERIAAIEEDKAAQRKRDIYYESKLENLTTAVADINQKLTEDATTYSVISKIFWIVLTGLVGTVAVQLLP